MFFISPTLLYYLPVIPLSPTVRPFHFCSVCHLYLFSLLVLGFQSQVSVMRIHIQSAYCLTIGLCLGASWAGGRGEERREGRLGMWCVGERQGNWKKITFAVFKTKLERMEKMECVFPHLPYLPAQSAIITIGVPGDVQSALQRSRIQSSNNSSHLKWRETLTAQGAPVPLSSPWKPLSWLGRLLYFDIVGW